jgi:hypothetical protein
MRFMLASRHKTFYRSLPERPDQLVRSLGEILAGV